MKLIFDAREKQLARLEENAAKQAQPCVGLASAIEPTPVPRGI
jgi:hypothetical protein